MACCTCSASSEEQPCEWLKPRDVAAVAHINGRVDFYSLLLIVREGCRGTGFPTAEAAARGSSLWGSSAGLPRVLVCRGSSVGAAVLTFVQGQLVHSAWIAALVNLRLCIVCCTLCHLHCRGCWRQRSRQPLAVKWRC